MFVDSSKNHQNDVKVFHFEDFSPDTLSENKVGRKGYSLFKLHHIDVPVPDFFVLSAEIFREFVNRVFLDKQNDLFKKGKNLEQRDISIVLNRASLDRDVEEDIIRAYTRISGFTDAWVSVRSSVSFPSNQKASFSGVHQTKLNVRNVSNLFKAIKEIYSSIYTESVLNYCKNESVELADLNVAIVVQRMVQAEVSGVCFTVDPITQDETKMSVEAVYGLGDVIANSELTPDMYVLNKKDLSIVEKHITPQEWMKVRTLGGGETEAIEKIQISSNWSHKQKLEDKNILEISKISLLIEDKLEEAVGVEWVLSGGRIWVLQTKTPFKDYYVSPTPVQIGSYSIVSDSLKEVVGEIVSRGKERVSMTDKAVEEAKRFVVKDIEESIVEVVSKEKVLEKSKKKVHEKKDEFLLSGMGASFGVAEGRIKIVHDGQKVDKGDILVIKSYTSALLDELSNCSGIILETGGLTSDIAIMCREANIPAIVDARGASELLKEGNIVRMDGNLGSVYKVDKDNKEVVGLAENIQERLDSDMPKEISEKRNVSRDDLKVSKDPKIPRTATKIYHFGLCEDSNVLFNSNGIAYLEMDEMVVKDGRHPLAYIEEKNYKEYSERFGHQIDNIADLISPNELILSLGSKGSKEFRKLVKGKIFENEESNLYGVTHYLNNKRLLECMLRIVKRVRNIFRDRNVSLAVHSPMNGNFMKEIKKEISSLGLRRTSTFNIYAVIENPAEIIMLDEILDSDIDGIILNTPRIAKMMQGVSLSDSSSGCDMNASSVVKVIDSVIEAAKKRKNKVIVYCKKDFGLITYCVRKGVHGVSVDSDDMVNYYSKVAEEEAKILLKL